jgi:molybdate transport system substrate-binding protein
MRVRRALCVLAAAGLLAGCASSGSKSAGAGAVGGTLVVFAAASLKPTFTELAKEFEAAHDGVKVVLSFGGSDSLAAQISQGAPVDVFASANTSTMNTIVKANDAAAPSDFAKNSLQIAVPSGNPKDVQSLADVTKSRVKLALCAATVPCGSAAAKAFAAAGLDAHPVTLEQDVTSVLTKVELGEVDAGLVYRTDVKAAAGKVDGVDFAEASSAVNTYPIAQVTTGKNSRASRAFVAFVLSAAGQRVLQAAGFEPAA